MVRECCVHCGCGWLEYVKRKIANGTYQVWVECQACGKNARGSGVLLKHDKVILEDCRTLPSEEMPVCERCHREGAELHHWAPRSIFGGEYVRVNGHPCIWPRDYLCIQCHQEWHSKMLAYTNGRTDA